MEKASKEAEELKVSNEFCWRQNSSTNKIASYVIFIFLLLFCTAGLWIWERKTKQHTTLCRVFVRGIVAVTGIVTLPPQWYALAIRHTLEIRWAAGSWRWYTNDRKTKTLSTVDLQYKANPHPASALFFFQIIVVRGSTKWTGHFALTSKPNSLYSHWHVII